MKLRPELSPEPSNHGEITFNGDPEAELGLFAGCHTPADLRRVLRAEVDTEVEQMLALVTDADAFDVIELMRMQEFFPLSPLLVLPDASALNVEIVAAMLLGRPSRRPSTTPHEDSRPDGVIRELHDRSSRLTRLANYRHLSEATSQGDSFALLAAQYQSSVLLIRNLRYDSIRDAQERQLFDNPRVTPLMSEHLGYTYPEVVAVRNTMKNLGGERFRSVVDETIDLFGGGRGTAQADVPVEGRKAFQAALEQLWIRPAGRAVMTPAQVAHRAGISETAAFAVMNSSAQEFDPSVAPANRVFELLTSTNPFLATPLVSDGVGNFVETTNGVGLDSLRRTVESALTNTKHWHTYDQKVRQVVSERLALDSLQRILGAPPALAGVKYYAPKEDASAHLLGRDSTDLRSVGKIVEGDGLFVIGDVAICVEVKGKSMSAPARRGDVPRLRNDLRATIGNGHAQAARLQALIENNHGLWLRDGTWFDLSHVREVRSVVALLDDIGPLGTNLGDHRSSGLLPTHGTPWITSLHDLETIAQVCQRPSEFLLYLRRRTDSGVTTYFKGADELDLFMLFMDADLYVEPDPDQLDTRHPGTPRESKRARRAHDEDAVLTFVGDQCAELDAWMNRGSLVQGAPQPVKPTYRALPRVLDLVDAVEAHGNGMVRFGADVFALSEETQQTVLDGIDECIRRTRLDGQPHDGMISLAGAWGHPTLFFLTRPHASDREAVLRRFATYMAHRT